jgi:serine/threonine-protein kinase
MPYGGSWGDDGNIVATLFAGSSLHRIPASGGTTQALAKLAPGEFSHLWPQVLPGGQAVLFTSLPAPLGLDEASINVLLPRTGETRIVHRGGYFGRYVPSGHLLYMHQGAIFAVAFDATRLEVRGTPAPIVEDGAGDAVTGTGQYDFSKSGMLVYLSGKGAMQRSIVWLDSSGKTEPLLAAIDSYATPRLSPDGKRLAISVGSQGSDVFVYDLQRETLMRLTFDGHSQVPVWSPDGRHIAFQSTAGGFSLCWVRSDGAGEPQKLLESPNILYPRSFSPGGSLLAYHKVFAAPGDELWTLPLDITDPDHPRPGTPQLFLHTGLDNQQPSFSPDGRWVAYRSTESGSVEIYVRPFPGPGGKWKISTSGGTLALWSNDGHSLFYATPDARIMVVDYTANGNSFACGKPRFWAAIPASVRMYLPLGGVAQVGSRRGWSLDLAPDGKRFAVLVNAERPEKSSVHVTILQNFFDELRRRVPSGAN